MSVVGVNDDGDAEDDDDDDDGGGGDDYPITKPHYFARWYKYTAHLPFGVS